MNILYITNVDLAICHDGGGVPQFEGGGKASWGL